MRFSVCYESITICSTLHANYATLSTLDHEPTEWYHSVLYITQSISKIRNEYQNLPLPNALHHPMHCNVRYCFFVTPAGVGRIRNALSEKIVSISVYLRPRHRSMDSLLKPLTLISHFVHHVHHNINLIHSGPIKVLPHCQCQFIFRDPSPLFLSSHRGRLSANARIRQERLSIRRCEGGRRRKVMRDSICVEKFQ